jgi:tetratricopeptide (TPR) repeat protein
MKKKAPSKKAKAPAKTGKPASAKAGAGKAAPKKAAAAKSAKPGKGAAKSAPSGKPAKASAAKSKPSILDSDEDDFRVETLLAKAREAQAADAPPSGEDAIDPEIKAALEAPASREEEVGLEKVMASLSQIFGGKDFLSDAELDALLDSKMASGEIPPSLALDPLDEAQSLVYEAWNSEGPHKIELARRALDLSKDCADAYIILAQEDAKGKEARLDLYKKAMDAGKRALDPALFKKSVGKFWEIMETRPYMRARLGLAESQWELGRKDEALEHLRDLMRLNPADDQGVRYILLQCLLESGADEELGALLDRYGKDTSPEIRYTHALWLFRRQGPGAEANARLKVALQANPHVPAYLLKKKKLSQRAPSAAKEGSEEEAEAYAGGAADAWQKTLGALDWLSSRSGA